MIDKNSVLFGAGDYLNNRFSDAFTHTIESLYGLAG